MDKATRTHIRSLLWRLKKTKRQLQVFSETLTAEVEPPYAATYLTKGETWSINQIKFYQMFDHVITEVLDEAPTEVADIFESKYLQGHPSKDNTIVSFETNLSESTVKRRDNEFLNEIANYLGWNDV